MESYGNLNVGLAASNEAPGVIASLVEALNRLGDAHVRADSILIGVRGHVPEKDPGGPTPQPQSVVEIAATLVVSADQLAGKLREIGNRLGVA